MADAFDRLRARLLGRFPPPIPVSLLIRHLLCGGEVQERYKWEYGGENDYGGHNVAHRLQCEKAGYEDSHRNARYHRISGCGGVWFVAELEAATDEQLAAWFSASDQGSYKLEVVSPDEHEKWAPFAYTKLVPK